MSHKPSGLDIIINAYQDLKNHEIAEDDVVLFHPMLTLRKLVAEEDRQAMFEQQLEHDIIDAEQEEEEQEDDEDADSGMEDDVDEGEEVHIVGDEAEVDFSTPPRQHQQQQTPSAKKSNKKHAKKKQNDAKKKQHYQQESVSTSFALRRKRKRRVYMTPERFRKIQEGKRSPVASSATAGGGSSSSQQQRDSGAPGVGTTSTTTITTAKGVEYAYQDHYGVNGERACKGNQRVFARAMAARYSNLKANVLELLQEGAQTAKSQQQQRDEEEEVKRANSMRDVPASWEQGAEQQQQQQQQQQQTSVSFAHSSRSNLLAGGVAAAPPMKSMTMTRRRSNTTDIGSNSSTMEVSFAADASLSVRSTSFAAASSSFMRKSPGGGEQQQQQQQQCDQPPASLSATTTSYYQQQQYLSPFGPLPSVSTVMQKLILPPLSLEAQHDLDREIERLARRRECDLVILLCNCLIWGLKRSILHVSFVEGLHKLPTTTDSLLKLHGFLKDLLPSGAGGGGGNSNNNNSGAVEHFDYDLWEYLRSSLVHFGLIQPDPIMDPSLRLGLASPSTLRAMSRQNMRALSPFGASPGTMRRPGGGVVGGGDVQSAFGTHVGDSIPIPDYFVPQEQQQQQQRSEQLAQTFKKIAAGGGDTASSSSRSPSPSSSSPQAQSLGMSRHTQSLRFGASSMRLDGKRGTTPPSPQQQQQQELTPEQKRTQDALDVLRKRLEEQEKAKQWEDVLRLYSSPRTAKHGAGGGDSPGKGGDKKHKPAWKQNRTAPTSSGFGRAFLGSKTTPKKKKSKKKARSPSTHSQPHQMASQSLTNFVIDDEEISSCRTSHVRKASNVTGGTSFRSRVSGAGGDGGLVRPPSLAMTRAGSTLTTRSSSKSKRGSRSCSSASASILLPGEITDNAAGEEENRHHTEQVHAVRWFFATKTDEHPNSSSSNNKSAVANPVASVTEIISNLAPFARVVEVTFLEAKKPSDPDAEPAIAHTFSLRDCAGPEIAKRLSAGQNVVGTRGYVTVLPHNEETIASLQSAINIDAAKRVETQHLSVRGGGGGGGGGGSPATDSSRRSSTTQQAEVTAAFLLGPSQQAASSSAAGAAAAAVAAVGAESQQQHQQSTVGSVATSVTLGKRLSSSFQQQQHAANISPRVSFAAAHHHDGSTPPSSQQSSHRQSLAHSEGAAASSSSPSSATPAATGSPATTTNTMSQVHRLQIVQPQSKASLGLRHLRQLQGPLRFGGHITFAAPQDRTDLGGTQEFLKDTFVLPVTVAKSIVDKTVDTDLFPMNEPKSFEELHKHDHHYQQEPQVSALQDGWEETARQAFKETPHVPHGPAMPSSSAGDDSGVIGGAGGATVPAAATTATAAAGSGGKDDLFTVSTLVFVPQRVSSAREGGRRVGAEAPLSVVGMATAPTAGTLDSRSPPNVKHTPAPPLQLSSDRPSVVSSDYSRVSSLRERAFRDRQMSVISTASTTALLPAMVKGSPTSTGATADSSAQGGSKQNAADGSLPPPLPPSVQQQHKQQQHQQQHVSRESRGETPSTVGDDSRHVLSQSLGFSSSTSSLAQQQQQQQHQKEKEKKLEEEAERQKRAAEIATVALAEQQRHMVLMQQQRKLDMIDKHIARIAQNDRSLANVPVPDRVYRVVCELPYVVGIDEVNPFTAVGEHFSCAEDKLLNDEERAEASRVNHHKHLRGARRAAGHQGTVSSFLAKQTLQRCKFAPVTKTPLEQQQQEEEEEEMLQQQQRDRETTSNLNIGESNMDQQEGGGIIASNAVVSNAGSSTMGFLPPSVRLPRPPSKQGPPAAVPGSARLSREAVRIFGASMKRLKKSNDSGSSTDAAETGGGEEKAARATTVTTTMMPPAKFSHPNSMATHKERPVQLSVPTTKLGSDVARHNGFALAGKIRA